MFWRVDGHEKCASNFEVSCKHLSAIQFAFYEILYHRGFHLFDERDFAFLVLPF
jgi:hypothetical protein